MTRTSPRSLRSAAIAVAVTGVLSISMPVLLLSTGGMASATQRVASLSSSASSCASKPKLTSRRLRAGQCLQVQAAGFKPRELIEVTELNRAGWSTMVKAGPTGTLSFRFELSAAALTGPDVLTFLGLGGATDLPPHRAAEASSTRVAFFRFIVERG